LEMTKLLGLMIGGSREDKRRHARMRAQTARLSALTQFCPTFGSGMGRPDRACLFGSGRWVTFTHFFVHTNALGCAMSIWVDPRRCPKAGNLFYGSPRPWAPDPNG
jgi:hypothetical protein